MVRFAIAEHTSLYAANGSFVVPTDVTVPRFAPGDAALAHLRREGSLDFHAGERAGGRASRG